MGVEAPRFAAGKQLRQLVLQKGAPICWDGKDDIPSRLPLCALHLTTRDPDMADASTIEYAFDNPTHGFESIYEQAEDDATNTLTGTLSGLRPPSSDSRQKKTRTEEKTIYVNETDGAPPEIDDLNEAIQDDWTIKDLSLEQQESTAGRYFVVTLERETPRSFFEVATSYSDPSLDSETT